MIIHPVKIYADVNPTPAPKVYQKTDLTDLVNSYADKYNVDRKLAQYVVLHESHYNSKALGDMNLTCKSTGKPVKARGLLQITQCYHPDLTDEQAFNPDSNLDYGMKLLVDKKTCLNEFTTCRAYYN